MLVLEVEFLHGVYHGDTYEQTFWLGREQRCEWPPSPSRVIGALASSGPSSGALELCSSKDLLTLETAEPPIIYAEATASNLLRTQRVERYAVTPDVGGGAVVQNYPGKTSLVVREGQHLAPRSPYVYYVWPDLAPDHSELDLLKSRAGRVGYLGTSEFPAALTVHDDLPERCRLLSKWDVSESGSVELPVAFPGYLRVLDHLFAEFSSGMAPRRGSVTKRLVRYGNPSDRLCEPSPVHASYWMRFSKPVPGSWLLQVTEALRSRVLSLYADNFDHNVPSVLHGHDDVGTFHAMYVALPNVGFEHSDGQIHGAAILLPGGVSDEVRGNLERIRRFLGRIQLSNGKLLVVESIDPSRKSQKVAVSPWRWTRPSSRWATAFPVVHERFKGTISLDEVANWCKNSGLPRPSSFVESQTSFLAGAPHVRADQIRRKKQRNPFSHFVIEFPQLVKGPVVLGANKHFGSGLFAPIQEGEIRL